MADQIILAWTVPVAGSSFGPAQAAAALAAVDLYTDPVTDPVLGQFFGLTVDSDSTTNDLVSATRTLTLNIVPPDAPPPFPCHPRTSTPPELPYPLVTTKTLPGSFFVELGSAVVATTATQFPSLSIGDEIQFLNQQGVVYTILSIDSATQITLTAPFTGTTGNTGAFKEVPAPETLLAFYSSSELDTDGVATVPVIQQGPGARTVQLSYLDSTGAAFTVEVALTGRRPAAVVLDVGSVDVAVITSIVIDDVGDFENSVGEITLVALSEELADLPPNLPIGTGIGIIEGAAPTVYGARTFKDFTDEAQLLIARHLAYVPPSFSALAQQQVSFPTLEGDFIVTTGSKDVPTTEDMSGEINDGDFIEFAVQPGTRYEVESVTDRIVRLVEAFTGIDTNDTGLNNTPVKNAMGTKGNIGPALIEHRTGARLVDPINAGAPVDGELAVALGQFTETQVAAAPPNPPLSPATVPTPTFLSDYFTQTIQLALAGVPITPATITFLP